MTSMLPEIGPSQIFYGNDGQRPNYFFGERLARQSFEEDHPYPTRPRAILTQAENESEEAAEQRRRQQSILDDVARLTTSLRQRQRQRERRLLLRRGEAPAAGPQVMQRYQMLRRDDSNTFIGRGTQYLRRFNQLRNEALQRAGNDTDAQQQARERSTTAVQRRMRDFN